jgi:hypothetical protein
MMAILLGCGSADQDPHPFRSYEDGCSVHDPFPCSDTTITVGGADSIIKRITTWEPGRRSFLEVAYTHDGIASDRSFLHHYDSEMRDSVIYWVTGLDAGVIVRKGWSAYFYDAEGNKLLVVLHNRDGTPYDSIHYYPDGTQREPCYPFAGAPCSETLDSITPDGDTVHRVVSWTPHPPVFTELTFSGGRLIPRKSFVHHYNHAGRDSIVYWVDSRDEEGELRYAGWGVYHYDTHGKLVRIDNNAPDGHRYGYIRYDGTVGEAVGD